MGHPIVVIRLDMGHAPVQSIYLFLEKKAFPYTSLLLLFRRSFCACVIRDFNTLVERWSLISVGGFCESRPSSANTFNLSRTLLYCGAPIGDFAALIKYAKLSDDLLDLFNPLRVLVLLFDSTFTYDFEVRFNRLRCAEFFTSCHNISFVPNRNGPRAVSLLSHRLFLSGDREACISNQIKHNLPSR
jgi:hypothetical protein